MVISMVYLLFPLIMRKMKTGPPKKEVKMATGRVWGRRTIRAKVSDITKRIPPVRAVKGSR
jgi:hypothetical protein